MKLFWIKNKVLVVTLAAVLILGIIFWGGLRLFEGNQMQDAFIRTAYAEAEATVTPAPQRTEETGETVTIQMEPTPMPTEAPTPMAPEMLSADILGLEWKYRSVFPRIGDAVPYEPKSWKVGEKVDEETAYEAATRVETLFDLLFHREINYTDITVTRYVDEAGYRPNILRMTDEKNDFVCVLLEKDFSLLIADNGLFAASEWMDAKKDSAAVAEYLGAEVQGKTREQGGSRRGGQVINLSTSYALADGRWITLAYNRNTLSGIQVHEDEKSMEELVCFQTDITMDPDVVQLAAPQNFVQGDLDHIEEGDMTVAEVTALYRRFLSAANGRAVERRDLEGKSVEELDYNLTNGQISYWLDKSGARENFYHIHHNDFVDMDIAAKSGYIVRAECKELYNPNGEFSLIGIPYDRMGGIEYIHYVKYVAQQTWGTENVKEVDVNAVYDGDYCTIDAYMMDGRMYEFFFEGGRMTKIEHYFQSYYAGFCIPGWEADSVYVNTITGETFVQE